MVNNLCVSLRTVTLGIPLVCIDLKYFLWQGEFTEHFATGVLHAWKPAILKYVYPRPSPQDLLFYFLVQEFLFSWKHYALGRSVAASQRSCCPKYPGYERGSCKDQRFWIIQAPGLLQTGGNRRKTLFTRKMVNIVTWYFFVLYSNNRKITFSWKGDFPLLNYKFSLVRFVFFYFPFSKLQLVLHIGIRGNFK